MIEQSARTDLFEARPKTYGMGRTALATLLRDPVALAAVVFLAIVTLCALFGSQIAPHDANEQHLRDRFTEPVWQTGDWTHVLGTDSLGRDVLSRIIVGARLSLLIGVAAGLIAAAIGVTLGLLAGYARGFTEAVIMRLVDLQMAMPGLLLILLIVNAIGPSVTLLIVILGFSAWMLFARVVRAETLTIVQSAYVGAARATGAPGHRIIIHHVAPNVFPTILTLIVLDIGPLILAEAGLSFLGLGIQPPGVAWGLMVAQGRESLNIAWWVMFFPGMAIMLTVLSLSLFAVWLRTLIDPLHRRSMLISKN
ncbi:hypothetical protein AYO38_10130 [bacterium SCGC AG-212-C10]|nr:hypothetical protein AYO38_10130 [bacterium SCGC AG-212-C10]